LLALVVAAFEAVVVLALAAFEVVLLHEIDNIL
jgi:hypothetical protein